MRITDIAIVGAGPAGAWAAYRLAQAGARVRLFDPSHPREKPCGGGVTDRALELVGRALDLAELPHVRITRACFVEHGSARQASVDLAANGKTLIVASRLAFDGALLAAAERAGATLVPARVRDIRRQSSRFHLDTQAGTFSADLLIGADGANSLVRRRFGKPFSRRELSIATGFYVFGATSDEIRIELQDDPPGYLWSFPRVDHLAIGICAQADSGVGPDALRARVADWIGRARFPGAARLVPYSWPIPSLDVIDGPDEAGNPAPGCLLIGDAAGLVDPITREGIFLALQSAGFAADAALEALPIAHRIYSERVQREICPELRRAARVKSHFFQPHFLRLLIEALIDSAPIRSIMADLFAGSISYRALKWRLAATGEFSLARRALQ